MSKKTSFALLALALVLTFTSCKTTPPYTVQLTEIINPLLPNLHSYTHATYGDKIILFGGRIRGLHSSNYNFGKSAYNNMIYVIDTHNWSDPLAWTVKNQPDTLIIKTDTSSAGSSPFLNAGQFRANNAEFFTKDNVLYVMGGLLGTQVQGGNPTTLPLFTAIDLKLLVHAVTHDTILPPSSVQQVTDSVFAITGGETGMMNNTVYLAFGWAYYGSSDAYTHKINSFTYNYNAQAGLSYTLNPLCPSCWDSISGSSNAGNFRRRDGSMSPMIDPADSSQAFLYYSGVFKNGNTNFDTPVWIKASEAKEDSAFHMRSNVYTCMVLPFYSRSNRESYATLLGGMTNCRNAQGPITNNKPRLMTGTSSPFLQVDVDSFLSVPFSNAFTTIMIDKDRKMKQYLLPDSFPAFKGAITLPHPPKAGDSPQVYPAGSFVAHNGAESELIWTIDQKYLMGNGVIDYDRFVADHAAGGAVGYLFGGIMSVVNNTNMSSATDTQIHLTMASNRLFRVNVIPYPKRWWQF